MKYILLMSGTKADFEGYAHWPEEVLQANMAFMRCLGKELEESGALSLSLVWRFPMRPGSCARATMASR